MLALYEKEFTVRKIVIPIITTPLIYLAIALTLVYIPVERNNPGPGLDLTF